MWDGIGTLPDWLATALDLHARCAENSTADDIDEDCVLYTNKGKGKGKTVTTATAPRTAGRIQTEAGSSTGFDTEAVAGLDC